MTESAEGEYLRLASQVADIEKLMRSGTRSDAGYLLAAFLENARSRMDAIRFDDIRTQHDKKERKEQEAATVAVLIERETNLNAHEKEQYGEFLKLDHYTKSNFGDLEQFYAHSWDKLSDGGKTEMSHRVWEGIRRDEYRFDEMPEELRKKEAEHLYRQVSGDIEADPGIKNIPQQDLDDFIREQEADNHSAVTEVLSRKVFTENVSSRGESANLADSQKEVKEPDKHGERAILSGTGPLANISPVQTVDEVVAPQVNTSAESASAQDKGANTYVR